jgi:hypothetical protein
MPFQESWASNAVSLLVRLLGNGSMSDRYAIAFGSSIHQCEWFAIPREAEGKEDSVLLTYLATSPSPAAVYIFICDSVMLGHILRAEFCSSIFQLLCRDLITCAVSTEGIRSLPTRNNEGLSCAGITTNDSQLLGCIRARNSRTREKKGTAFRTPSLNQT